MESQIAYIAIAITAVIMLLAGLVLGRILSKPNTHKQKELAEQQAQQIIAEAKTQSENLKRDKQLEAKEKFLQLKSEHEKEVQQRNRSVEQREQQLKQKEVQLNQKLEGSQRKEQELQAAKEKYELQIQGLNAKKAELDKLYEENIGRLEKIAKLTQQEAKAEMIESLKAGR